MFGELGAAVIASDRLSHEVLESSELSEVLREWWGERVFGADGRVDCGVIRQIVTKEPEARQRLEKLLHPQIAQRREALMAAAETNPDIQVVVWDSPLLYEAGLVAKCDSVVFVEANEKIRCDRVCRERSWSAEELEGFEKLQKPLDFKRNNADYIIVNNSDMDALRQQSKDVFSRILSDTHDR